MAGRVNRHIGLAHLKFNTALLKLALAITPVEDSAIVRVGIELDEIEPFDRLFDKVMESQFPNFAEEFGVKCFEGGAYPKVNVYEYEDKIGIVEIKLGKIAQAKLIIEF